MVKILVVDDEQEARQGIRNYLLRKLNCEVEEAENGEEALDKINSIDFDLIILDIRLPGINGIDILRQTKNKKLDYLVISGYDSISVAEEALKEGAKDYISKPFSMDILAEKVKIILSQKNQ